MLQHGAEATLQSERAAWADQRVKLCNEAQRLLIETTDRLETEKSGIEQHNARLREQLASAQKDMDSANQDAYSTVAWHVACDVACCTQTVPMFMFWPHRGHSQFKPGCICYATCHIGLQHATSGATCQDACSTMTCMLHAMWHAASALHTCTCLFTSGAACHIVITIARAGGCRT